MTKKKIPVTIPAPHLTLFQATREGLPALIVVNDTLLSFADSAIFPWHLSVTFKAQELIEHGMPSLEESNFLSDLSAQIESALLKSQVTKGAPNSLLLARSTWNGTHRISFYVHNPKIAQAELDKLAASKTWERQWTYTIQQDAAWENASFLFQLFPQAKGFDA